MPINTSANLNSIIGASIARNLDKTNTSVAVGSVNVAKNTKNVTQKLVESQELVRDTRDRTENIVKSILETTHVMNKEDIDNIFNKVNNNSIKEDN